MGVWHLTCTLCDVLTFIYVYLRLNVFEEWGFLSNCIYTRIFISCIQTQTQTPTPTPT